MTTQGEHERNLVLLPRQLALSCGRVSERTLLVEINPLLKILWCLIPAHFWRNFTWTSSAISSTQRNIDYTRTFSAVQGRVIVLLSDGDRAFWVANWGEELGFRGRMLGHWVGELVDLVKMIGIHSWSLTFLPLKSYLSNRKILFQPSFFFGAMLNFLGVFPLLIFF